MMRADAMQGQDSSELVSEDAVLVLRRLLLDQRGKNPDEDILLAWQALTTLYETRGLHEEASVAKGAAWKAFRLLQLAEDR